MQTFPERGSIYFMLSNLSKAIFYLTLREAILAHVVVTPDMTCIFFAHLFGFSNSQYYQGLFKMHFSQGIHL